MRIQCPADRRMRLSVLILSKTDSLSLASGMIDKSLLIPYTLAMPINDLRQERIKKLENIRKLAVNPYPSKANKRNTTTAALAVFEEYEKEPEAGRDTEGVTVTGRLKSLRSHGKILFADLEDFSGRIQLFFSQENLNNKPFDFEFLANLDIGDFIQASGKLFKTQAGQVTIRVEDYKLLTKSISPIPTEWFGLKDIETRLRKRYLDLLSNPNERELFLKKARFWGAVRKFLLDHGFIEVETPSLEPIPGGADARPFITHHQALDQDFYLRISLELYQKRILVGGFEKIFEIGRIFRNEGIDAEHLQDYTQLEFYWAYADYQDLMKFQRQFLQFVIKETIGSLKTVHRGEEIDWSGDWPKLDYGEAFKKATGIDLDQEVTEDKLREYAKEHNIPIEEKVGKGRLIDSIYKRTIRPDIIQPTFLINHPVEVSPLAKRMPDKPNRVERVQLLAGGTELTNGFSELNDPVDQLNRFKEQESLRERGDEEAQMIDMDFVEALEYGMPPAAGFGMSERVFAFLVDRPIREIVFFPAMREGL